MLLWQLKARDRSLGEMAYLDLGCGAGDMLALMAPNVASAAGCDPSAKMLKRALENCGEVEIRFQPEPTTIPFESETFDLVTAICVYHHVPLGVRVALSLEILRVLKPGGLLALIEHNPYNPVTQTIVRRTPVDADANLLTGRYARRMLSAAGYATSPPVYFLYLSDYLYRRLGQVERSLSRLPLGGQYAVFGQRPSFGPRDSLESKAPRPQQRA